MNTLIEDGKFIVHRSPDEPVIDLDVAHLWICDLDDVLYSGLKDWTVLSTSERARAERLKGVLDKRRFVVRCALVRRVLGNLLGITPSEVEFYDDSEGKPRLLYSSMRQSEQIVRPDFNVSHTENIIALAVAFGREVGIDIEMANPETDMLAVARMQFTVEEFNVLVELSTRDRIRMFYLLWTRNEALSKMDGRGIASWHDGNVPVASGCTFCPFELMLGEKEIIGTLALGERMEVCEGIAG